MVINASRRLLCSAVTNTFEDCGYAVKARCVHHDHVIQALASDGADDTVGVLPRRSWRRSNFLDVHPMEGASYANGECRCWSPGRQKDRNPVRPVGLNSRRRSGRGGMTFKTFRSLLRRTPPIPTAITAERNVILTDRYQTAA